MPLISPNYYRIHSIRPSTLVHECLREEDSIIYEFQDEATFNLTWDCPIVETEGHALFYNPQTMGSRLLQRSLEEPFKAWLESLIPSSFTASAERILCKHQLNKVNLCQLQEKLDNRIWDKVRVVSGYLGWVAVFVLLVMPCGCCYLYRKRRITEKGNKPRP